jgi:hypothetical protein
MEFNLYSLSNKTMFRGVYVMMVLKFILVVPGIADAYLQYQIYTSGFPSDKNIT